MRRVSVVGTTGSGKTTLARQIGDRLGLPHVELDALYWDANWTSAPPALFHARAQQALAGETWVVDGNYSKVRDIVWSRADTIVWLDYALPVILFRLIRRTVGRVATQEPLWNGNREQFRSAFLSRDSILVWALRTHWRHRRDYSCLLARPENAHLAVVRLCAPAQTARWLDQTILF